MPIIGFLMRLVQDYLEKKRFGTQLQKGVALDEVNRTLVILLDY
jgi:hypothetical protein